MQNKIEIYAHLCCVMLQLIYVTKHYSTILIASQYSEYSAHQQPTILLYQC